MSDTLFTPYDLGGLALRNRVVMAPMTRSRSIGNIPGQNVATHYAQRAEAGLIITEGTSPSPDGLGYPRIPGLYSSEQAAGWRRVTDAVHAEGGRIFVQLMHTGRVGVPENLPSGARLRSASAVAAPGQMFTDTKGLLAYPTPEAMDEAAIEEAIESYVRAARLAVDEAGFDGVELHGANGYLIDQFLNTASNQRTDGWGGTIEGRLRFALETTRRVIAAIGGGRVGLRISPFGVFNGMTPDEEMIPLYLRLAEAVGAMGLGYLHLVDHSSMGAPPIPEGLRSDLRSRFPGAFILSGGYDRSRAEADLDAEAGDLVAFGRPFIANPRLVSRLAQDLPLAAPNQALLYTPGDEGYIDYSDGV